MANLYNTDLGQNARRSSTGGSNFGTRRIQLYLITVYGISDAEADKLDNYRAVNNSEIDIDQPPEREYRTANVVEAVMRAVQENSELYIVGHVDVVNEDPDYNTVYLTVGTAGDTFSSGNEMDNRDDPATRNNDNPYLNEGLSDTLDEYLGPYDGYDVTPAYLYGDQLNTTGGTAIPAPQLAEIRAARKEAGAPARLARRNGTPG